MLRTAITLLLALLQAAAALVIATGSPDFSGAPARVQGATVAVFFLALAAAAWSERSGFHARREKLKNDAHTTLIAALARVLEHTGAPIATLGVHAYCVERTWTSLLRQTVQVRIARVRLSHGALSSSVEWSGFKGVVGECMQSENQYLRRHIASTHSGLMSCSPEEWAKQSSSVTMGMTYAEWESTKRYAAVFAFPIQKDVDGRARYLGCVALDCTETGLYAKLASDGVRDILGDAAQTLAKSIVEPAT